MDIYTLIEEDQTRILQEMDELAILPAAHFANRFERFQELSRDVQSFNYAKDATIYDGLEGYPELEEETQRLNTYLKNSASLLASLATNTDSPAEWDMRFHRFHELLKEWMAFEKFDVFPSAKERITAEQMKSLAANYKKKKASNEYLQFSYLQADADKAVNPAVVALHAQDEEVLPDKPLSLTDKLYEMF